MFVTSRSSLITGNHDDGYRLQETEDLDLPMDRIHKGVEAVLKQQHLGAYYVILQDSQVIAQLMITYEWSDWRNATVWWIQSVYVRPPYRRRGCFRRLYQHVRAAAAAAGAGGLRLYADDDNSSAHATVSQGARLLGGGCLAATWACVLPALMMPHRM
jgi:GNAT superfamily N-acetyltransferase